MAALRDKVDFQCRISSRYFAHFLEHCWRKHWIVDGTE
jgi:hypothetical protein